jgi:hypothetical protein
VMPRHKAATWVGPGRKRKSTQPGANGVIELAPFEFLDRLADLIPQPRRHRHRYHGVFAPNHPLRSAVTALAIGNIGKRCDAATSGHADGRHAATDWGELVQVHDDRDVFQSSPDELPAIDIHSL